MEDRIFIPLNTQPWKWFERGLKRWEIRRAKGQFNPFGKKPPLGRDVELRRGYSTPDKLFGRVCHTITGPELEDVINEDNYKQVIPTAISVSHAICEARDILGEKPGPFIAMRINLKREL